MLPDIQLDEITFEEMLEKAKNIIAGTYPEWTDFNYHDPGITFIELFAWLKEIQQYELNHIGEHHRRKYLNLLGTEMLHRKAAKTYVSVKTSAKQCLPAGCGLQIQEVPFETKEIQTLPGIPLCYAFGWNGKKISYLDQEQLALGHTLEFYPFGKEAMEGTSLYLAFEQPLPVGETLCLTCWVGENQRNPADENTIPLAKLSYTFWDGAGYQPLEILRDETLGFLFDGQLVFKLPHEMKKQTIGQEHAYFLRIQLKQSQYEMPPLLRFLDINTVSVQQKETVAAWLEAKKHPFGEAALVVSHGLCAEGRIQVFHCEEELYREVAIEKIERNLETGETLLYLEDIFLKGTFFVLVSKEDDWYQRNQILGVGKGFPNESYFLEEELLSFEDLEILVEDAECPGIYRKWEKRTDFSNSGPEDCHYCIDSVSGKILFGNCIYGMAPEGKILLVSYARVLGSNGNVKANKICHFTDTYLSELLITNPKDAVGGCKEESVSQAFERVRKRMTEPKNMVTLQDYEQAVKQTPGLWIESCKALTGTFGKDNQTAGEVIQIVVKPKSLEKRPKLKPVFVENIRNYLEPKRMLGVGIRILSPIYGKVSVYLEVTVHPQYQRAKEQIYEAVESYIRPLKNEFGCSISYSGLYGHIDRLECVSNISSLGLEAKGNGIRRNTYGDLLFPGNGGVDEIEIYCSCSVKE